MGLQQLQFIETSHPVSVDAFFTEASMQDLK